jgi:tetratricopeptide (TPR) repeat protein
VRHDEASSPEQEALMRALARTADARRSHGRYSEADRLYRRALALAEDIFGEQHLEIASILDHLALLKEAEGRFGEAEEFCRRAWRMRERLLGADHPDTATSIDHLAVLLRRMSGHSEPG